MNNKKGISLIVLVITILVMIILAGVVIVSLQNDNPVDKAKEAKAKSNEANLRQAVVQYVANLKLKDTTDPAGNVGSEYDIALSAIFKGKQNTETGKFEPESGKYILDNSKAGSVLGVGDINTLFGGTAKTITVDLASGECTIK